jgi:predicted ATP-grasp superfamily ATP-dependent carboligase
MKPDEPGTVLLTLGRLPVALDIARSFSAAGWRVIVAEPWSMHLARMSRAVSRSYRVSSPAQDHEAYLDDLATLVSEHDVRLVIPVSEESMHVAALHERLPDTVEIFCAPQPQMLAVHDKASFIRIADELDLPVPATRLASASNATDITEHCNFVTKPRFSCSGRGVRFHAAGDRVAARPGVVLQERLDGDHISSFAIARDGLVLASTAYRGTVMDGSVAVCFERVAENPAIDTWVTRFVAATGHTGFIAFDFIVTSDGQALPIECNPRATSGIHFVREEYLARAILGDEVPDPVCRDAAHLTESYSCFTATLGALFSRESFRERLRLLRDARDVTWSKSDPWPFLLMMVNTWRIVSLSLFGGHSFAAAAVLDIEWQDTADA